MQSARIQLSSNTRYLLWKAQVPREGWVTWLGTRLHWPPELVGRLVHDQLDDKQLGGEEVAQLSALFGFDGDDQELRYRDLAGEHGDTLRENLRYLLGCLKHGGKKDLARAIDVDPTTISRWLNGSFAPHKSTLRALLGYFGLPHTTDLEEEAIYLSADPIAQSDQRRWLKQRVDRLSTDELRSLFPAFRRLLGNQ